MWVICNFSFTLGDIKQWKYVPRVSWFFSYSPGAGKMKSTMRRRQPWTTLGARSGKGISFGVQSPWDGLGVFSVCCILATSQHSTNGKRVAKSVGFSVQTERFTSSLMPLPGDTSRGLRFLICKTGSMIASSWRHTHTHPLTGLGAVNGLRILGCIKITWGPSSKADSWGPLSLNSNLSSSM